MIASILRRDISQTARESWYDPRRRGLGVARSPSREASSSDAMLTGPMLASPPRSAAPVFPTFVSDDLTTGECGVLKRTPPRSVTPSEAVSSTWSKQGKRRYYSPLYKSPQGTVKRNGTAVKQAGGLGISLPLLAERRSCMRTQNIEVGAVRRDASTKSSERSRTPITRSGDGDGHRTRAIADARRPRLNKELKKAAV